MKYRHWSLLLAALLPVAGEAADPLLDRRADGSVKASAADDAEDFGLWGIMAGRAATRDTDKFERDVTRIGTPLHYASPYEFLAVGASRNEFRQHDWSLGVNSLVAAGRKVNRQTAEGYSGRLAFTTNTPKHQWHGEGSWNVRLGEATGVEFIASRDAVESVAALERGILYNFLAVSVDRALTERLTLIGMPTYQRFTDGNERNGWRGAAIYSLLPDYGLSLEVKARAYDSSEAGSSAYFNPKRYERGEYGLRLRRSFGDWRVFATASAGREYINGNTSKPTQHLLLSAHRSFAKDLVVGGEFAYYRASDTANVSSGGDDFSWRMGRLYVSVPF